MDWITVKLKAGKILPALATTTSSIAALETLEMCKILIGCDKEELKDGNLNLAIPSV